MMIIATHAATRSSETREISAAATSSLSAIGSMTLPNWVTAFARAREEAVDEVGDRGHGEDDRREQVAVRGLVEERDHEDGDREDPQQCEDVREIHGEHRSAGHPRPRF
jgi:hypothetical protein